MLMSAVDTYLAVRRAAGYKLRDVEQYLRDFAHFATTGGDSHVVAQTAIRWATHPINSERRARGHVLLLVSCQRSRLRLSATSTIPCISALVTVVTAA